MCVIILNIVPAKTVPAAAVRQGGQVLFYMIWRKGCVGCLLELGKKFYNKSIGVCLIIKT